MEIITQSTEANPRHPYVHLGYVAASDLGGVFGAFLILIGIVQLFSKNKRNMAASIVAIVLGVIFMAGAITIYILRN